MSSCSVPASISLKDMSSEDENMAIDQRADASDASLDHASIVCSTTAIVALDKAILSLQSTLTRTDHEER